MPQPQTTPEGPPDFGLPHAIKVSNNGVVGSRGTGAGEFDIVHHMAVDSNGNLYTAEIVNQRRAQKFELVAPR